VFCAAVAVVVLLGGVDAGGAFFAHAPISATAINIKKNRNVKTIEMFAICLPVCFSSIHCLQLLAH
jgi:hypothetical protein